jgi:hypothetical protein
MIDISTESILSLREAAKLLPSSRLGRPCSFQCILRWILNGTKSPDGQIVKLEALRLGGRWITSREALQRFAEALTPPTTDNSVSTRTPKHCRRAADRAEQQLERLGI